MINAVSKTSYVDRFKVTLVALAVGILSSCAVTVDTPEDNSTGWAPIQLGEIYLRGIFNWWEADPAYLLSKDPNNSYSVTIDLIADGQPYDFRLADEFWSPLKSCGAKKLRAVSVNTPLTLYCAGNSQNLQFTPLVTGRYLFTVEQREEPLTLIIDLLKR
jgi:hypothetical protein